LFLLPTGRIRVSRSVELVARRASGLLPNKRREDLAADQIRGKAGVERVKRKEMKRNKREGTENHNRGTDIREINLCPCENTQI
jgi:hypothetical protein